MVTGTRRIEKRTLVAFHEAGHAVIGAYFGKQVLGITMLEGERLNASTTMTALEPTAPRPLVEAEIEVCLAGLCAELIGFGQHHDGHRCDFERARSWIERVSLETQESRDEVLHRLEKTVQDVLRQPVLWGAVETVADYVLRYGAIDGATLLDIMRHHTLYPVSTDFDAFRRFN
jgi:Peptidase family M41